MNKQEIKLVWLEPGEAQLNPDNWRIHQQLQLDSLKALIFDEGDGEGGAVGWAGAALVNDRQEEDGWEAEEAVPTFIDGHARQKLAAELGEQIPAIVGRWTPDEERMILATLDPLAGMAGEDTVILSNLRFEAATSNEALKNLLGRANMTTDLEPGKGEANQPDPSALFKFGYFAVPMTPMELDVLSAEAWAYVDEFGMAHGFIRTLLDRRDREKEFFAIASDSSVSDEEDE